MDFNLPAEDDSRRTKVRKWFVENPKPSYAQMAKEGYVTPNWPAPWGLSADPELQLTRLVQSTMPPGPKTGPALFLGLELATDQLRASIVDESLELVGVECVDFDTELPEYQYVVQFAHMSCPPYPNFHFITLKKCCD